MSAVRKSLLPAALIFALVMASVTPAAARKGIWAYVKIDSNNITFSLVNMTSHRLVVTSNPTCGMGNYCDDYANTKDNWQCYCPYCSCVTCVGHPFVANTGVLYVDAYSTAIWASRVDTSQTGEFAWDKGHFDVLPEGLEEKWQVRVYAASESPDPGPHPVFDPNLGSGTWFWLDRGPGFNDEWYPSPATSAADTYAYGIWVTPINTSALFNVMTLSGTKLAVSLFQAGVNNHLVLAVRETFWDSAAMKGDDYIGWPLDFEHQPMNSMPN